MKKRSTRPAYAPTRQMYRRCACLIMIFSVIGIAVLLARLYKIQITDHAYYEALALSQQMRSTPGAKNRGTIFDRNLNVLAVSATVDNVYISPVEISQYGENRELIAQGLAQILNLDYNEVYDKTGRTGSYYVTVARKLEKEKADELRRFKNENNLRGVHLEADTKRYYPNSSLACHVLGFVGVDNIGLEGTEAHYNAYLSGTAPQTRRLTNALGTDMPYTNYEAFIDGDAGCDIVMTIDSTIQFYVEKHLKQAVADYDIQNGAGAIAMDVNTGEILAMVSLNNYDLNNFLEVDDTTAAQIAECEDPEEKSRILSEAQMRQWRNKTISDTYEPGSTFKILTLSMALEEAKVGLSDSFFCPGYVSVPGRTSPIRCWKTEGHGSQNLTQAVQHSCNAAFVNIGLRIGAERFYEYCEAFGLLELNEDADAGLSAVTDIDLSGESGSIWWSRNVFCSEKNLSQLAAASFGQTFTITPLQLIRAVSACVNGGYLMEPYVVRSVNSRDGSTVYVHEPKQLRQVISEDTSKTVRSILEKVVGDKNDGTGRNAAVSGFRIGGKTGTSEKVSLEAKTGLKEYIVSFVGFAPADEPKIALLVFLDTPSNESGVYISGGQMAAPVVGNMLADILPYLGVPCDSEPKGSSVMPIAVGLELDKAAEEIKSAGLRYRTIGQGSTVTSQLPAAGVTIAEDSEIILYLGAEISTDTETMPDLTGLSYDKARDMLSYYGLYINSHSEAGDPSLEIVGQQSVPAGTLLDHGSIIEVTLIDNNSEMLGRY